MSDCGVCLSGFDGQSDFVNVVRRVSRKSRRCCECSKTIAVGETYEASSGKSEGDFWSFATCLICAEIADAFYCDGRIFGGCLWDDMDNVLSEMTTGCLNRLRTAAAKAELLRRWRERKGL